MTHKISKQSLNKITETFFESYSRKGLNLVVILFVLCSATNYIYSQQSPEPMKGMLAGQPVNPQKPAESGLLFYLSGKENFKANFAAGSQDLPNYLYNVDIITDGAKGSAFSAGDSMLMAYWAPGNIYTQRGTLSFFWRSRYPVGLTPFPIFRVGYADHSSWDMVWLRIDYNGSGFDAFVTDIGLSRPRVSYYPDRFPRPEEWTHISLSWDETMGIKFYVNGEFVAQQSVSNTVFDAGLDQFGPFSRTISPYRVQSAYCFMRGGDIDEIRIYDRMLSDENIKRLAKGQSAGFVRPLVRDFKNRKWRDEWWLRHGWNLPNNAPPILPDTNTYIRKVEIHEAVDIKRWFWKANDGIRETTWPGVYNMSRIPGRYDYFVLPDWDCYSGSGQAIKFTLPDEPWNHVEVWGKAWGQLTYEKERENDFTFGVRTKNQIKSVHRLDKANSGGKIRFDNSLIEEPIGSLDVYCVREGVSPAGTMVKKYILSDASKELDHEIFTGLKSFITGRYPADERTMMAGVPEGNYDSRKKSPYKRGSLPFIHILIPYDENIKDGLDGVEIRLPSLPVKATHDGLFPVNIRVKDPLWPLRDLADISFSLVPGKSQNLWIDTRDRILPSGGAIYITLAGAGSDFTPEVLNGTRINLVYKFREEARKEHEQDRFTQIRDLYGHIVEERPVSPRLNLFNRIFADCEDLLNVNPHHWLARTYRYALTGENKPEYEVTKCPDNIPEWAFYQIEYLKKLDDLITYYIDNRQIGNGEFGGGLSDDGDFTNMFPGVAFLGIEPEKILSSLKLHMKAYYNQYRPSYDASLRQRSLPLFTNGLATIFTDELHAYEDGIQVVGQLQLLDYGNPLYIERGMEIASRVLNDLTKVNSAGHRHIRSRYYSGIDMAVEDPWQWIVPNSYNILHTAYLVALYNGNPNLKKMFIELADGLLAHYKDRTLPNNINFTTDEAMGKADFSRMWQIFYAAWIFSGNQKYIVPIEDYVKKSNEFNPENIATNYINEIKTLGINEFINTLGSTWIDRLSPFNPVIQEDRLGGVALRRINNIFPRNLVSWNFSKPGNFKDVAIYLNKTNPDRIGIIAYNLDSVEVSANVTFWQIEPGIWRLLQGVDIDNDQKIDRERSEKTVNLECSTITTLKFKPKAYTIIELDLIQKAEKGYSERPDLGIGVEDIKIEKNMVTVRIHSLGAVDTPPSRIELKDELGKIVGSSEIPSIEAPLDLKPRMFDVKLKINEGINLKHGCISLDPENTIQEITKCNNQVKW